MNTKDALNQCLEKLRSGLSLEECLAAYPDKAAELEPLLRAASALGQAPQPSPQFQAVLGQRLEAAWQSQQRRRRPSFLLGGRRWALASALALALVLGGASTAWASSSSVPGDVLYPAKRATERVRLVLTFSKSGKASLELQSAGKRVKEMAALVKQEAPDEEVEKLVRRLEAHLDKMERMALEPEESEEPEEAEEPEKAERPEKTLERGEALTRLRLRLEKDADQGLSRVQQELEHLPEAKKARLRALLEKADMRYEQAWRAMKEPIKVAPSVTPTPPPWRQKRLPPTPPHLPLRPRFKDRSAFTPVVAATPEGTR